MREMFPYPSITGNDAETQIQQIKSYLIQMKEILEDVLTNISSDNLSEELKQKLSLLGINVDNIQKDAEKISAVNKKNVTKEINNKQYVIVADINTGMATIKGKE